MIAISRTRRESTFALWILSGLLFFSGPGATSAEAESFAGVNAGYWMLTQTDDLDSMFLGSLESGAFDGGTVGLHVGHYFTANLGAELSVEAYLPGKSFVVAIDPEPILVPVKTSLALYPISLSARYRLWPERLTPVATAGVSLNPYDFDVDFPGFPGTGVHNTGIEFGYQFGIGAELPFSLRWSATSLLLYRSIDISVEFLDSEGTLQEFKPDFSGLQLQLGFAYLF